ncbi:MAG: hypothetical protein ACE5GU_12920 [Candidatus Scalinduaceae bacterium]
MKKVLFLIPLLLFSMGSLFADKVEKTAPEQLPIDTIHLKSMLDGKCLTCVRPFYRRNFPLIRLGGIREMDGHPAGPFDVQFKVNGSWMIRGGTIQTEDCGTFAEIEGSVTAVQAHENALSEKQMEDLFLGLKEPWIYEMPVERYFATDSGILMNLKPEAYLSPEEEELKMKKMEAIRTELDEMIEEQHLENKRAVELVDKEWHEVPSGLGDRVKNGRRKIVLIFSQQGQERTVEEVLFVIESPTTHYEETVAWCARSEVIDKAVRLGRKRRHITDSQ